MNKGNYEVIIDILMRIAEDKELSNVVFVSGGIVPWLVSKRDSKRNHGDIDFIVSEENMPKVRRFLIENNLYEPSLDSLNYEEANSIDYGVDTFIDSIPIGFYPFEQGEDGLIIQRSFTPNEIEGRKDLKVKKIPMMELNDYLSITTLPNSREIGISSLEVVKASKELVGREKDMYDIKEIDRIGYNSKRYERVKKSIENMILIYNTTT